MNVEEALSKVAVERKSKRLRLLWPLIEAKLAEGVSHAAMLDFLNRSGFELSERTYKSYLYRHRKAQRLASRPAGSQGVKPTPVAVYTAVSGEIGKPATFDYDPAGIPDLLK